MNVKNIAPNDTIAAFVERVLVIEHYEVTSPFSLPLFANGSPTLAFVLVKGTVTDLPLILRFSANNFSRNIGLRVRIYFDCLFF